MVVDMPVALLESAAAAAAASMVGVGVLDGAAAAVVAVLVVQLPHSTGQSSVYGVPPNFRSHRVDGVQTSSSGIPLHNPAVVVAGWMVFAIGTSSVVVDVFLVEEGDVDKVVENATVVDGVAVVVVIVVDPEDVDVVVVVVVVVTYRHL
jgi:hypothetical protein